MTCMFIHHYRIGLVLYIVALKICFPSLANHHFGKQLHYLIIQNEPVVDAQSEASDRHRVWSSKDASGHSIGTSSCLDVVGQLAMMRRDQQRMQFHHLQCPPNVVIRLPNLLNMGCPRHL